jgi:hypothetical protein
MARGQTDPGANSYNFLESTYGSGAWGISKRLNSVSSSLASSSSQIITAQWMHWKVTVAGSTLKFVSSLGLTTELSTSDTSFASGIVGILTWGNTVSYVDNYRIRKYTSPEPTTSVGAEEMISPQISISPAPSYGYPNPTITITAIGNSGDSLILYFQQNQVASGTTSITYTITQTLPVGSYNVTAVDLTTGGRTTLLFDVINVGWLSGWGYRKPITINNTQNSNTLSNYQVLVTLDTANLISNGKMMSDCRDIRFTDINGQTLLSYWIESGCNTANTRIWVKVPNIPASSTKTIYVYYGNSSVSSQSNGAATFDFFDDFLGTSLNTTRWYVTSGTSYTVSNSILKITTGAIGLQSALQFNLNSGYLVEARVQYNSNSESGYYSGALEISSSRFIASGNANADATILYMVDSPAYSTTVATFIANGSAGGYNIVFDAPVFSMALNTWYILGDEATPSTAAVWKDYSRLNSYSVSWAKNIGYLSLGAFEGGSFNIKDTSYDWVRVRKYIPPEPVISVGAEQVGGVLI